MPRVSDTMERFRTATLLCAPLVVVACAVHTPPRTARRPTLDVRICFRGPFACSSDRRLAEKYLTHFGRIVIDRYKKTHHLIIDREVMVLADLDADGAVQQLATLQTSGDAALDSAVEELIRAAAPFGQLPSAVQTVQVELTMSPQKKPKSSARGVAEQGDEADER